MTGFKYIFFNIINKLFGKTSQFEHL